MDKLSGTVGRGGDNRPNDVKLIQNLLNKHKIPGEIMPLPVNGTADEKTYKRIEVFQKKIMLSALPETLISANSKTFQKLVTVNAGAKAANTYSLSNKAVDLLKSIEELATKPYDDQTGKEITSWVDGATIGYGHLIRKNEWDKYKNGITEPQAVTLFKADLAPFVSKVKTSVTAKIKQNEFDALVLLTYNIGEPAFASSSVLTMINNPSAKTAYANIEQAWKAFKKSQGKVMNGLNNRRQAELDIYFKNVYKKW